MCRRRNRETCLGRISDGISKGQIIDTGCKWICGSSLVKAMIWPMFITIYEDAERCVGNDNAGFVASCKFHHSCRLFG